MKQAIKIGTFILALLLLAGTVQAISIPLPVSGKVIGTGTADLIVQVQNLRTGEIQETKTTYAGEWLVDWANAKTTARPGDTFQVKIGDKTEKVIWNGEPSVFIEMHYNAPVQCDCGTDWLKVGAGAILGIIAGLIACMGGGLKAHKNKLGGVTIQHKHKGITAYHDPNTSHKNLAYKHRRWKDDPMGCIEDVKKIEEKGGLI